MIRDNQLLGNLVLDAVRSYKASLEKINPIRSHQLERVEALCMVTEYDDMLISGIQMIIKEIKRSESGWFGRYPSRLHEVLQKALTVYHEIIEYTEIQAVLLEQVGSSLLKKPELPTQARILEEVTHLVEMHPVRVP